MGQQILTPAAIAAFTRLGQRLREDRPKPSLLHDGVMHTGAKPISPSGIIHDPRPSRQQRRAAQRQDR